jgi:TolB-like protein/tetratricopeptide (TPR) repeat protein
VTEPARAVFLSYASQDEGAASRICEALRAASMEVWFDKSELRGGEAWDHQIRQQIHDCRLFLALISAHTEARDEGYFRREWRLAVERAGDMAEKKAFLVPVVIDGTPERGASVPEKFHELQWMRLPSGEASPVFVERIRRLMFPEEAPASRSAPIPATRSVESHAAASRPSRRAIWAAVALAAAGLAAYLVYKQPWTAQHAVSTPTPTASSASAAPAAFNPPPHSIAVLPFVNISGDREQEYFSDGLTEELLNSLARVDKLQVAARTSAFSFKGKDAKIGAIARELNVGAILEGSVRRSGQHVRITAQLINAITGYHLWSETYDRDLSDVLAMQSDIANAVAGALKVTLLGDVAAKIEVGGTRNPAAFDAYLHASETTQTTATEKSYHAVIAGYTEAIRLDPDYALAYAARSAAFGDLAMTWARGAAVPENLSHARSDALKAIELAPQLPEGHAALGVALYRSLEFTRASQECEHAMALAPGKAGILSACGFGAVEMGQSQNGLAAVRRSVVLDPLNFDNHLRLGQASNYARRFEEAIGAYKDALAVAPSDEHRGLAHSLMAFTYYFTGDLPNANANCELAEELNKAICLAVIYDKLGRHADAEAAFKPYQAYWGAAGAMFYSAVYAHWGQIPHALDWLETAMRNRDPYLVQLRMDPLFDPLRKEARYQEVMRQLRFPD